MNFIGTVSTRLSHAWNAFNRKGSDINPYTSMYSNMSNYRSNPYRKPLNVNTEKSIVTGIYMRIALDVASLNFKHAKVDDYGFYVETIKSSINDLLTFRSNKDQTHRDFIKDVVMSMFDEGEVAIVPIETSLDPTVSNTYDIGSWRTGKILEYFPNAVKVQIYNDQSGKREDVVLPKKMIAIIVNPFYEVMNQNNSVGKRLIAKLNLLDSIDSQTGSNKLDLIIQLPYSIRTESSKTRAADRAKDIDVQLTNSKYGIAYIDASEKVTQLNRPVENNLLAQIEFFTSMLYGQLGVNKDVIDGTASREVMQNYFNNTVDVVATAIQDGINATFLTKTARTQKQAILYIKDPFKMALLTDIADSSDSFTRNEILSSNEIRSRIGLAPRPEARANELKNKNINESVKEGGIA